MSKVQFQPIRSLDKIIQSLAQQDGCIYFATDTGKIYLDAQGTRVTMGGNGIGVFYANSFTVNDRGDGIYVLQNSDLEEENAAPRTNDLIINIDGKFLRVITVDEDTQEIQCSLLSVSGTGGGPNTGTLGGSMTLNRLTAKNLAVLHESSCQVGFTVTAVDSSGESTGNGRYEIWLRGKKQASGVANQGDNYVEIGEFLQLGTNELTVKVFMDVGLENDVSLNLKYTITATALALEWKYNELTVNDINQDYVFEWSVSGANIDKITHIIINEHYHLQTGETQTTQPQYLTIKPSDYGTHGIYTVSMYVTSPIIDKPTSKLTRQMIFADPDSTEPLIGCGFYETELQQYNTVQIPVFVYDPNNNDSSGTLYLKEDSASVGTKSNVSNLHWETFNYTPTSSGVKNLLIQYPSANDKRLTVDIKPVTLNVKETPGYAFKFKATDFANDEAIQNWNSNGVTVSFNNFDWINGGLRSDNSDGVNKQCVYIPAGSSMTINYDLLRKGPKSSGKSFKIIFKTTKCRDYDAKFLDCVKDIKRIGPANDYDIFVIPDGTEITYSTTPSIVDSNRITLLNTSTFIYDLNNEACRDLLKKKVYINYNDKIYYCKDVKELEEEGQDIIYYVHWYPAVILDSYIGLEMRAQKAQYNSKNTLNSVAYCEDTYIDFEIDIEPMDSTTKKMYVKTWMDGVPTSIINYDEYDDFIIDDSSITIGSMDCDVCVYLVRAYEKHLTDDEHLANFIMDAPNANEMLERYRRNDIIDPETLRISPTMLAAANPDCRVHVYDIERMTLTKNDKIKKCSYVQYHGSSDPVITSDNATIRVQGTSSAAYGLAAFNLDTDFGTSLKKGNGESLSDGWSLTENSIPCTYFTTKVNVASVEQANNALNQEWYNAFQPYKSVLRCKNPKARDTMEFTPGVLFIADKNPKMNDSTPINNNIFADTPGYTGQYHKLYSVCNMGNSKKNIHVCHDLENPLECCVEVSDNQTPQQWMTDDTFVYENIDPDKGSGYKEYYSFRYPDGRSAVLKLSNGEQMLKGWKDFVSWMAQSNPQPMYNQFEDIQSIEQFNKLAINPETMQPINVYVLINNEYIQVSEYNEEIHTYYTKTANKYGYTNLALKNPVAYGPYTFVGFKTTLQDDNGELWQKDYTPLVQGYTCSTYDYKRYVTTDESGNMVEDPNNMIASPQGYTHDTYEYRMAKMLHECENHLIMDAVIYHYLFVERHCLIDNIAKNTFWSTEDGVHWAPIKDYDNDTSDGGDNNGKFTRNYGMEALDKLNLNEYVFNARQSVWFNFIYGLPGVCQHIYNELEKATAIIKGTTYQNAWNAENYLNLFTEWQKSIPERCWIEGYYRLYERPHRVYGDSMFLAMMQGGRKAHQRKQYETYQNYYISSKYFGVEASSTNITIRGSGTKRLGYKLPVKMYSDCYVQAALGSGQVPNFKQRVKRNEIAYIVSPIDDLNNITFYLYAAPLYQSIGETGLDENNHPYGVLNGFGPAQFSAANATRLRKIVFGTSDQELKNASLTEIGFENNELLEELYIANCVNTSTTLDLSKAPNLKLLDATNSSFTSIKIADGAPLESLKAGNPETLVLSNLRKLETLDIDYANLSTLHLNNIDFIKNTSKQLVDNARALDIYELKNIHWELNTKDEFNSNKIKILERLKTLNTPEDITTGYRAPTSVCLTGLIEVTDTAYNDSDSFEIYNSYVNDKLYPNLNIDFKGENAKLYNINIYNGDGKVSWHRKINAGAELNNAFLSEGPEGAFDISKITKMNTLSSIFKFINQWKVYNEDSGILLDTIDASSNNGIPVYSSVNCNLSFMPIFNEELRKYTLTFYDVDGNVAEIKKEEPYGKLLSAVTRSAVPYKDDSELPYNQTYGFIGYGLTATATSPVSSDYIIQSNQDFYPIFKEMSVYDNILDASNFTIVTITDYKDTYDSSYDYKGKTAQISPGTQLRGKITFPAFVPDPDDKTKNIPVQSISGCTAWCQRVTHCFFDKNPQGIIRTINSMCFAGCTELKYIEFPHSLRNILENAFQNCHLLSMSHSGEQKDLIIGNQIAIINRLAFEGIGEHNNSTMDIYIGPSVRRIGSNAFAHINRIPGKIQIGMPDAASQLIDIYQDAFTANTNGIAYSSLTIYAQNLEQGQDILEKLKTSIDEDVVVSGGYSNMSVVIVP